ncbi:Ig-like domain-containing protein [Vibrio owensii]|uniref:Ig-like domain-containing protein n=1 Tax=Vibrio owensii TaxID=696485 RepID=UPI0038CEDB6A
MTNIRHMSLKHYLFILLFSLLITGCNNEDDGLLGGATELPGEIAELVVSPKNSVLPVGLSQPLKAEVLLANNQVVDVTKRDEITWVSSNEEIAIVDSDGVVTGRAQGEVVITASGESNGEIFSDTAIVEVTAATVTSLVVTPTTDTTPVGLSKPFKAMANLSDGTTTIDVTNDPAISWSSSDSTIATVSNTDGSKGEAKGEAVGTVTITASGEANGQSFSDTATLEVTAATVTSLVVTPTTDTTPVGLSKPFKAMANLSDGTTTIDVTNDPAISWSSSDSTIATVSNTDGSKGEAKGEAVGTVTITASGEANGQSFSDTATLEVTAATVTSLVVTPTTDTTPVGLSKPFKAMANLSDGTTTIDVTNDPAISWSSSDSTIATVSNTDGSKGEAKGEAVGTVTITASGEANGQSFSDTATLEVTAATVTSLVVTPTTDTTPVGLSKPFKAMANLSDGTTTIDVTNDPAISWSSSDSTIATVSNTDGSKGEAKGEAVGTVTITASGEANGQSFSDTATLEVTAATVTSLVVTPTTDTTPVGLSKPFKAMANLSDGTTTIDVTNDPAISWSSSDSTIATVSNTDGSKGEAKGEAVGTVTITASGEANGQSFSDTATLEVVDADFYVSGFFEYGAQLSVNLAGVDRDDVTITWMMDLDNANGINENVQQIPENQGGSGDSLNYTIGTYQYSIENLGLIDLNTNGVIDDDDWKESNLKSSGVLPAQFFIGKDIKVCVEAKSNTNAENLIGPEPICKWVSEFTHINGVRCEDSTSCVSGGIIANNQGDIRIEPIRVLELVEGFVRSRIISIYEIPEPLRSKVNMETWNGIDWAKIPVGGSDSLGLDNNETKQVAVDVCKLQGGFLPIADSGFLNDLEDFGNEASSQVSLAEILSFSAIFTGNVSEADFVYNGPISGQYSNDFVSASVQGTEDRYPGVTFDVWVDTSNLDPGVAIGNVVPVAAPSTSAISCARAL